MVKFRRMNNQTMNMNDATTAAPGGDTPTCAEMAGPPARKPMSARQLAANRRNAEKSTGPKTPAGRAAVAGNAVKHGIFSKEVLVKGLHIKENSRELSDLRERFWHDLDPIGPVEEMLVDQIVTTHWRWRRALKAEAGEIALSVDQGRWKRQAEPELEAASWVLATRDPIRRMKESVRGIELLVFQLDEIRDEVERQGELTPAAIRGLLPRPGDQPNSLAQRLEEFRLKLPETPPGLDTGAWRERNKKRALAFLDDELFSLNMLKEDRAKREAQEEQSRQAASVLPSMKVLARIIGYETKLERQLYRAMTQLERLQRLRRGEAVPPPLKMEMSA
jgi:hypothetical protein